MKGRNLFGSSTLNPYKSRSLGLFDIRVGSNDIVDQFIIQCDGAEDVLFQSDVAVSSEARQFLRIKVIQQ